MSEPGPPDAWHDKLHAAIRARAEDSRRRAGPTPTGGTGAYNWPEVSSLLERAAAVADIDAPVAVSGRHAGLRRALVVRLRRLIAALLRFLTIRQSAYNRGVLHALRETGKAVRALERRAASQEREIEKLRERLRHLEATLPADGSRKAS